MPKREKDPAEWEWKEIEDGFFKQFKFRPNFRENLNGAALNAPDDLVEIAIERVQSALRSARDRSSPSR